jgi:hypothetical protein
LEIIQNEINPAIKFPGSEAAQEVLGMQVAREKEHHAEVAVERCDLRADIGNNSSRHIYMILLFRHR